MSSEILLVAMTVIRLAEWAAMIIFVLMLSEF